MPLVRLAPGWPCCATCRTAYSAGVGVDSWGGSSYGRAPPLVQTTQRGPSFGRGLVRIDKTVPFIFSADDFMDIGEDGGAPVTEDYDHSEWPLYRKGLLGSHQIGGDAHEGTRKAGTKQ